MTGFSTHTMWTYNCNKCGKPLMFTNDQFAGLAYHPECAPDLWQTPHSTTTYWPTESAEPLPRHNITGNDGVRTETWEKR